MTPQRIYFADNLEILEAMDDGCVDLIYIDPPFNSGKQQKRTWIRTLRSEPGDGIGFDPQSIGTAKRQTN